MITFSIVSHGHGSLVDLLLADLSALQRDDVEVVVTNNDGESARDPTRYRFPLREIRNCRRRGFGANHNSAFAVSNGDVFVVLNPDVRMPVDPCDAVLECLRNGRAIVAPEIVDGAGLGADSARAFPTRWSFMRKAASFVLGRSTSRFGVVEGEPEPDWIAGMFMAFPADVYRELRGFDERYFLYYEDVDICARARRAGVRVRVVEGVAVVHDARRDSRRRASFLRRHLVSAVRYYTSGVYRWTVRGRGATSVRDGSVRARP